MKQTVAVDVRRYSISFRTMQFWNEKMRRDLSRNIMANFKVADAAAKNTCITTNKIKIEKEGEENGMAHTRIKQLRV